MNRFHVHIAVHDLAASVDFYSALFDQPPSVEKESYARWMLEDPRVNFAISSRGHATGVNHFGMQADSPEELDRLRELADRASRGTALEQGETVCCYARSRKHWLVDPQGLAWEHFITLSEAPAFGDEVVMPEGACCIPLHSVEAADGDDGPACCIPGETPGGRETCCVPGSSP